MKAMKNRGRRKSRRRYRRRRRNTGVVSRNPRRRYRRRRRRNTGVVSRNPRRRYHRRRRRYNSAASVLRSPVRSLTQGFNVRNLKTAGLIAMGGVANGFVGGKLVQLVPQAQSLPFGSSLLSFGSAGVVGALGRLASKEMGGALFTGALAQALGSLISNALQGRLSGIGDFLIQPQVAAARQISGVEDFLIQPQVAAARQISDIDAAIAGMDDVSF